jgi:hypothetical protein
MSIEKKKARVLRADKGTVGGTTYLIKLPGEKEGKLLCFRRMKNQIELRCTHQAGFGTDHVGTGACKYHGGANTKTLNTIVTGRHAFSTRTKLQSQIDNYLSMDRGKLLDLTEQLAATKAILDAVIEQFPDTDADNYGTWLFRFNSLVNTLSGLVERLSRIESRNTLTNAQVLYLRATMVDILMKYLPDPDTRERVAKELASRLGGDIEITMQPSEVYSLEAANV